MTFSPVKKKKKKIKITAVMLQYNQMLNGIQSLNTYSTRTLLIACLIDQSMNQ